MPNQNFNRQTAVQIVDRVLDVLTVAAAVAIPLFFLTSPIFLIKKNRWHVKTPKSRSSLACT